MLLCQKCHAEVVSAGCPNLHEVGNPPPFGRCGKCNILDNLVECDFEKRVREFQKHPDPVAKPDIESLILPQWRGDWKRFLLTGEMSDGFRAYLETNQSAREALELIFEKWESILAEIHKLIATTPNG